MVALQKIQKYVVVLVGIVINFGFHELDPTLLALLSNMRYKTEVPDQIY